jgi:large repetitive protein
MDVIAYADPVCEDGMIQFFASGGTSYVWYKPGQYPAGTSFSSSANPVLFDAQPTDAGTYTVVVTNAEGCIVAENVDVIVNLKPVIETPASTEPEACGQSNGNIIITVAGDPDDYEYLWNTGATTKDLTGISSGSFSVIVTDKITRCSVETIIPVDDVDGPEAALVPTHIDCYGANTGSIALTITQDPAFGPYSVSWTGPGGYTLNTAAPVPGTYPINNLFAGNYNVVITDNNGCRQVASVMLTQPNPLTVDYTQINVGCFGEATGSINVLVSGGTPGYNYSWTGPTAIGNTPNATNLLAGTYTVTVTDANNCEEEVTIVISQSGQALAVTANPVAVKCFGGNNGLIILNTTGGTGPYTYDWADIGTAGVFTDPQNRSSLTAGTYSVTIKDAKGCTFTLNNIQVNQPLGTPDSYGNRK